MLQDVIIRAARADEIIDLRWRILRAGLERSTACFDGDDETTTHHFVAEQDGRIIGCVTILRRPWDGQPAWQLRGMAVEPSLQRRGVGRQLVDVVESTVTEEPYSLQLWCNARTPASAFYQKLGWEIASGEFVIPTAGPHVKMTKRLKPPRDAVR